MTDLRESQVIYPAVQVVHVLGLVLMIGTVVIVDLRLLNVLLRRISAKAVCEQLLPIAWIGFWVLLVSGPLLFAAQAEKIYGNPYLRAKFILLIVAGLNVAIFHRYTYKTVASWGETGTTPFGAKLASTASLFLWTVILSVSHYLPYYEAPSP